MCEQVVHDRRHDARSRRTFLDHDRPELVYRISAVQDERRTRHQRGEGKDGRIDVVEGEHEAEPVGLVERQPADDTVGVTRQALPCEKGSFGAPCRA